VCIILFYKYVDLADPKKVAREQSDLAQKWGLLGRILIAGEGINGTLSGPEEAVAGYMEAMGHDERFGGIDFKDSSTTSHPFPDITVKVVSEIINSGAKFKHLSVGEGSTGTHLTPDQFHRMLQEELERRQKADPPNSTMKTDTNIAAAVGAGDSRETVVLDIRNHKEFAIGHFDGALDIETTTYAQTPQYIDKSLDSLKNKRVLMYCTGGVRCEKASAYLRSKGPAFQEVYQLGGGIHRYLQQFPQGGLFNGKNFVFDKRVSLAPTEHVPASLSSMSAAAPAKAQSSESSGRSVGGRVGGRVGGSVACVGRCISCSCEWDQFAPTVVCSVCRDLVLMCTACRVNTKEFHCDKHQHVSSCAKYTQVLAETVSRDLLSLNR
jgi:predicted sulfurtransferase